MNSTEETPFYKVDFYAVAFRNLELAAEVGALSTKTDLGFIPASVGNDYLRFGTLVLRAPQYQSRFDISIDELEAISLSARLARQSN